MVSVLLCHVYNGLETKTLFSCLVQERMFCLTTTIIPLGFSMVTPTPGFPEHGHPCQRAPDFGNHKRAPAP